MAAIRETGDAYTATIASQAPRSGLVTLLAGATTATNNRHSKVAILGFIGLLAGIIIGAITAILREQRRKHTR